MKGFLKKTALAGLLLCALVGGASAQSVAQRTTPGYNTLSCGTGPSPCFVQYGATVPVTGTITPTGGVTAADGAVLTNTLVTYSYNGLYNGTTEDLWREIVTGNNTTGTGVAAVGALAQCDDTAPQAITENRFGNLRLGCTDHALLMGTTTPAGVVSGLNSVVNATNSTGAGIAAAGLLAQFDDSSPQTVTENQFGNLRMSTNGILYVGGNVASAATDSGNPVKVGCKFNNARPTFTDGQRADLQCDSVGNLPIAIYSNGNTSSVTVSAPADATNNAGFVGLATRAAMLDYNGSTWDRKFNCPNFAAISVTAGNTTQIIALSGSTVIRVCNITVTTSLTGSWTMLSGTGSNCATPANSTGAMPITTGVATTIGDGAAGVYRGSSGGELCITAVTGNITGWVMYAQY